MTSPTAANYIVRALNAPKNAHQPFVASHWQTREKREEEGRVREEAKRAQMEKAAKEAATQSALPLFGK